MRVDLRLHALLAQVPKLTIQLLRSIGIRTALNTTQRRPYRFDNKLPLLLLSSFPIKYLSPWGLDVELIFKTSMVRHRS